MAEDFFRLLKGGVRFESSSKKKMSLSSIESPADESATNSQQSALMSLDAMDKVHAFRKSNKIKVYGTDAPLPVQTLDELLERFAGDGKILLENAANVCGYSVLTPIQMQAIPILLDKRDIFGIAPTGSGKTLAFLLPIIYHLQCELKRKKKPKLGENDVRSPRAIIVAPTHELAEQIYRETVRLTNHTLTRVHLLKSDVGMPSSGELCHLLISTPLRLVYDIREKRIDMGNVRYVLLDEGDKLLDMGFLGQIDEIIASCTYQPLLRAIFSATLPPPVEQLATTFMHDPLRVVIGTQNAATDTIHQKLVYVGKEQGKLLAFRQSISLGELQFPLLIFVQSIDRAEQLYRELMYDPIRCDVIHANRSPIEREQVVRKFRLGEVWTLICTELMSRGLDFQHVRCVVNYDMPQSITSYIHRVGRTGRAGRLGTSITMFTDDDKPFLRAIAQVVQQSGGDVPGWMLTLQKPKKKERRHREMYPPKREAIDTSKGAMLNEPKGEQKRLQKERIRKEKERKRGRLAVEEERAAKKRHMKKAT